MQYILYFIEKGNGFLQNRLYMQQFTKRKLHFSNWI